MSPEERQHLILEGAITYFAEFGFDRGTRDLARHLGVSQALVFRYFPTKAALVDRIYDVVFLNRWNEEWETLLADRTRPLDARLTAFYRDYERGIDRYDVIRISLFSALRAENLSKRYFERIREHLIRPMVGEFRHALGLPGFDSLALHALEEELVFSLHAKVIYGIMRRHVFDQPSIPERGLLIELYVQGFMAGADASFRRVHEYARLAGGG